MMNNIIQISISYIVSSIYLKVHRTIYIGDQKGSVDREIVHCAESSNSTSRIRSSWSDIQEERLLDAHRELVYFWISGTYTNILLYRRSNFFDHTSTFYHFHKY